MTRNIKTVAAAAFMALLPLSGCIHKDTKFKDQREAWEKSLPDSVKALRAEMKLTSDSIVTVGADVDSLLLLFAHVSHPREVEGYSIVKGWQSRYPLTSTGLIARITEGGSLELVAALSGSTFTRLEVSSGDMTASTAEVPYDQALNYRGGGLNTVAFSGPQADSVAMLVAGAAGPVKLTFSGGSARTAVLAPDAQKMIATTYAVTAGMKHLHALERRLPILEQKIKLVEARISKSSADSVK